MLLMMQMQAIRINRYMLGCKFNYFVNLSHCLPRINRYMLGCKCNSLLSLDLLLLELIDTCWDVNSVAATIAHALGVN